MFWRGAKKKDSNSTVGSKEQESQTVPKLLTQQHLQFLCTPTGSSLGDLLQLLDSLTEVRHPLNHSHGGWNSVATPAAREDALREVKTAVHQLHPEYVLFEDFLLVRTEVTVGVQ